MRNIAGTWKNEYESQLILSEHDEWLYGIYRSHTGSTGRYNVIGCFADKSYCRIPGSAVAFAVYWRNLDENLEDPSWHWVSGMAGQLHREPHKESKLLLNHNLVVTNTWHGICEEGAYLDKLTFHPGHPSVSHPQKSKIQPPPGQDPINGLWKCDFSNLCLELRLYNKQTGEVRGSLKRETQEFQVRGFVDCYAENKIQHEGLTLVAPTSDGKCLSLSGSLDLKSQTLALLMQSATGTNSNQLYLQTMAQGLYFKKSKKH